MGKRGKTQGKAEKNPKKKFHGKKDVVREDMDDEIDAFHKQRDMIPLDANLASEDSDGDEEVPVFDFEDGFEDKDESDEDEDHIQDRGLSAKIVRQQKYLREKFGDGEDAMDDDEEEEEEEDQKHIWGGNKSLYYNADNADFEVQSSDNESLAEEEAEAIRLQKENAKSMSMADFGLADSSEDESDRELTLKEKSVKGKSTRKSVSKKGVSDEMDTTIEEVKKDLNSLSREELNDVLYRSAPELVGLLSELNDATQELENKVDPLLKKVENGEIKLEGGIHYVELKKQILLSYCQSIVFYLVLKSEGQYVRDHPVLARIVEIKSLLDKTKELDKNCPMEIGEILTKSNAVNSGKENVTPAPEMPELTHVSKEIEAEVVPINNAELASVGLSKENGGKAEKRKRLDDQVGVASMKMFKVRAALEEKLKQKGFLSSTPKAEKALKHGKLLNRRLETYDDFDDDTANASTRGLVNGNKSSLSSTKVSQLIAAKLSKPKVISGDDDLPVRDDIGERRIKHELRVLARAGVTRDDEEADMDDDEEANGEADMDDDKDISSEDDFYKQVKQRREAKLSAKAEIYSRSASVPSLPETSDGKRLISYQMEKNRGLTRQRKKLIKNPRKKYKLKHQKAVKNRGGQVRQVKKPTGQYGGESSGINARISRSIRFNN